MYVRKKEENGLLLRSLIVHDWATENLLYICGQLWLWDLYIETCKNDNDYIVVILASNKIASSVAHIRIVRFLLLLGFQSVWVKVLLGHCDTD